MEITVIQILTPTTHYVGEAANISVEVILYYIIVASQLQVRNVGTILFFQNQVRCEVIDLSLRLTCYLTYRGGTIRMSQSFVTTDIVQ